MILRPESRRYLHAGLLGLSLLFAISAVMESRRSFPAIEPPLEPVKEVTVEKGAGLVYSLSLGSVEEYAEIVERPLFTETRRPSVLARSDEDRVVEDSEYDYRVSAIVIADGNSLALIERRPGLPPEKVKVGDALDGWKLAEVKPASILLRRGEETRRIELEVKASPNIAPSAEEEVTE